MKILFLFLMMIIIMENNTFANVDAYAWDVCMNMGYEFLYCNKLTAIY
jgi:uncharacterized integral membrane protein